jgi:hypothetical protein
MSKNFIFSSESVGEGHPDKVCDTISDAVLDACLAQDKFSRVACECYAKSNIDIVGGEITTRAKLDFTKIARDTIREIGYVNDDDVFHADKVFVNTITQRVKYFNIRRDSRVCFLVDDGYPHVILFGKARIAGERDAKKDIETLAVRYIGEEAGKKAARERYWKDERTSIEIQPERVISQL